MYVRRSRICYTRLSSESACSRYLTMERTVPMLDSYIERMKRENPGRWIDNKDSLEEFFCALGKGGACAVYDLEAGKLLDPYLIDAASNDKLATYTGTALDAILHLHNQWNLTLEEMIEVISALPKFNGVTGYAMLLREMAKAAPPDLSLYGGSLMLYIEEEHNRLFGGFNKGPNPRQMCYMNKSYEMIKDAYTVNVTKQFILNEIAESQKEPDVIVDKKGKENKYRKYVSDVSSTYGPPASDDSASCHS